MFDDENIHFDKNELKIRNWKKLNETMKKIRNNSNLKLSKLDQNKINFSLDDDGLK